MIVYEESVLPSILRLPGEYISGPIWTLPAATHVTASINNRQTWQRLGAYEDVLTLSVEINTNGQWILLGACTSDATPSIGRNGQISDTTTLRVRLPRERIPQPQIRIILTCLSPCDGGVCVQFDNTPLPTQMTQEHHSVTYDNDNEAFAVSGTSITIGAFAVGSNVNRAMVVGGTSYSATGANGAVSTVSHNGSTTGWNSVISQVSGDGLQRVFIWRKVAVDVVSATVVVTFVGECTEIGVNAMSVYDVHQTTPMGTAVGIDGGTIASPGTATINVSGETNDLVYDVVYSYGGTTSIITVGAGQTQRMNNIIATYGGARSTLGVSTEAGATTVTMSWDLSGDTDDVYWMMVGCAIKVAAAVTSKYVALEHGIRGLNRGLAVGVR